MIPTPQSISIFLDDSGVFSKNHHENYFVYAGYLFLSPEERSNAKRQYRTLSDTIHASIGHSGELKASNLSRIGHRRALVNVMKEYESLACVIFIPTIRQSIKENKLSIHRYKDYALKIAIKRKLETLISTGKIKSDVPTELNIYIDEQHTSTDGFYGLKESIKEEFLNGIRNLDYGTFHPPLFTDQLKIGVEFCDSSANYLVQASDMLANRINKSYNKDSPKLRRLPKLHILNLP